MIQDQNRTEKPVVTTEEEDEIDLVALVKTVWKGRKTLLICMSIGAVLGLFVAISTPKEYTATTIMVPQTGSKGGSQLGGLAALAGISLNTEQGAEMSPILYPKIVNSIPFKLELMKAKINFSDIDQPISLFDYYTNYQKTSVLGAVKKYTIGLPGVITGVIISSLRGKQKELVLPKTSNNQPLSLSKDQYAVKKALDAITFLEVDAKQGFLTLTVNMPEAFAAAQVAQVAQDLLQRYITEFKIEKAQADLEFIQGRYNVAKAEAERYQVSVAVNTDRIKNLTSTLPQVGNARTQTQYAIANSVFQDLAKQLEQAKIQVKKDTPVFTIVEPVVVPSESSKPNRPMILVIWIFLGGFLGVSVIFGKHFLAGIKQKWNE